MKVIRDVNQTAFLPRAAFILSLLILPALNVLAEGASSVVLWDSGNSAVTLTNILDHSKWKAVPGDLLTLEADPLKAGSDPGYYGRGYLFRGDAVVESRSMLAVLSATNGRVVLYSRSVDGQSTNSIVEMASVIPEPAGRFDLLEIVRNGGDEVVMQVSRTNSLGDSVVLGFGREGIVEIKPSNRLKAFTVSASLDYVVLPAFIGDDLIYGAQDQETGDQISLPSENLLLGLLRGENAQFVMTWPKGHQRLDLNLGNSVTGRRPIKSVQFENDGQAFYLAATAGAGIWHRELLSVTNLEKDVAIEWKKPFPARWKTELFEETLKTTYVFRSSKGDIWRGVPGSYDYPVWFEGDKAFYHLSKKVPPKGESVIYFLEGQGTPSTVQTPVDILKSTLGRPMADAILDPLGRKLRTHHRRGGEGVHRACTCGCTEAIQAVFEAGEEVDRKEDIRGDLEDMLYFVHHHVDRIDEYRHFADEMIRFLDEKKRSSPALGDYLDRLSVTVQQIPQECSVQKENMKSFDYADQLFKRTMSLTEKKDPGNLKAYLELLKEWRAMGGAQDYVLAQCHIIGRKLAQEAGYGCAAQPNAVVLAQEIRARVRQCLRNPDGYEVWADY